MVPALSRAIQLLSEAIAHPASSGVWTLAAPLRRTVAPAAATAVLGASPLSGLGREGIDAHASCPGIAGQCSRGAASSATATRHAPEPHSEAPLSPSQRDGAAAADSSTSDSLPSGRARGAAAETSAPPARAQGSRRHHPGHKPWLDSVHVAGGAGAGGLAAWAPEGDIMAAIRAARTLRDMELLVAQLGHQFKHMHIAAVVQRMPALDAGAMNRRRRVLTLMDLMAAGMSRTIDRFDPHQLAACLAGFAAVHHLPLAVVHMCATRLTARSGAPAAELHPYELASVADALAEAQSLQQGRLDEVQRAAAAVVAAAAAKPQLPSPPGRAGALVQPQLSTGCADTGALLDKLLLSAGGEGGGGGGLAPAPARGGGRSALAAAADASPRGGGALARRLPVEELWAMVEAQVVARPHSFALPDLATAAWAFARARRATAPLMAAAERSVRLRANKLDPGSTYLLARALAAWGADADGGGRHAAAKSEMLPLLGGAVVSMKAALSPRQLAGCLGAFAALGFHHGDACRAACKMLSGRGRAWPPADALSLMGSLAALRHADAPAMAAVARCLPAWAPALPPAQLVTALWALVWLGYRDGGLEDVVAAVHTHVPRRAHELRPGHLVQLLWCCAVLDEHTPEALLPLLERLRAASPGDLTSQQLLMLYQAHRLTTSAWKGAPASQQLPPHDLAQPASAAPSADAAQTAPPLEASVGHAGAAHGSLGGASATGSGSGSEGEGPGDASPPPSDPLEASWPPRLVRAAVRAAAAAAQRPRRVRQLLDVLDALEDAGLEAAQRLPLDGGGAVADVAVVTGPLKVAVQCSSPSMHSRSVPHTLMGAAVAHDWILEAMGWRVVHVPWYEWEALKGDPDAQVAHVYNRLAEHKIYL